MEDALSLAQQAHVELSEVTFVLCAILAIVTVPAVNVLYGKCENKGLGLSYAVSAPAMILWGLIGYSMAYGSAISTGVIGGSEFATINEVGKLEEIDRNHLFAHIFYSFMYAILALSIISGGVGQYFKKPFFIIFTIASLLLNYLPFTMWIWNTPHDEEIVTGEHNPGWLTDYYLQSPDSSGTLDYSGGLSVHSYAGLAVLFLGLLSQKGRDAVDFGSTKALVASFAFFVGKQALQANSGSNADESYSSLGSLNTVIACYTGVMVYGLFEMVLPKSGPLLTFKPTFAGAVKGAMVGIVTSSAGAGFTFPGYMYLSTVCSCALVFLFDFATKTVNVAGWDCFVSHGVAGIVGSAMVGLYAQNSAYPSPAIQEGGFFGDGKQLGRQCAGISIIFLLTAVATVVIYGLVYVIALLFNTTPLEEEEKAVLAAAAPSV